MEPWITLLICRERQELSAAFDEKRFFAWLGVDERGRSSGGS